MVAVNSFRVSGSPVSWDDLNSIGIDKWPIVESRLDTDVFVICVVFFALVSVNH